MTVAEHTHPEKIQEVLDLLWEFEQQANDASLRAWITFRADGLSPEEIDDEIVFPCVARVQTLRERLSSTVMGFEDVDGRFWMDEVLAQLLDEHGDEGARIAHTVRTRSHERWLAHPADGTEGDLLKIWRGEQPAFMSYIVSAVLQHVLPELDRMDAGQVEDARRRHCPAVSAEVVGNFAQGYWAKNRKIEETESGPVLAANGHAVAPLKPKLSAAGHPVRAIPEGVSNFISTTRKLTGHRLLRWCVSSGFDRFVAKEMDFRKLVVKGGFSGLARTLGMTNSSARDDLRDALDVMACVAFDMPGLRGQGLLTWWATDEAPGRPSELHIVLADPLLPEFVTALPGNTQSQRAMRRLVPVPAKLPPLYGGTSLHAAQAALQQLVLREFRNRAVDLVTQGGISIPQGRWVELSREADLDHSLLPKVIDHWIRGTDGEPAFLAYATGGGLTLAPAYQAELDMLREAGRHGMVGKAAAERKRQVKDGKVVKAEKRIRKAAERSRKRAEREAEKARKDAE